MQDVHSQLESAGLIVDGNIEIGRLIRCKTDGDKGTKKSGWYVLHEFRLSNGATVVAGSYGNWKRYGDEPLKIAFDLPPLSDAEKAEFARRQAELREQSEREKLERAQEAARRANKIFFNLPDCGASEYLKRKKVRGYGLRFSRGSIVVPVRNIAGDLVGLQFIDAGGEKKFLTGTPKRGCFHVIGTERIEADVPIAFAEGYATAASIHMAVEWPVVIAFDAGNLLPVAQVWREKCPDRQFIICADNDTGTEGNPGVSKAAEAARIVGARLCIPDFSMIQVRAA